MVRLGTGAGGVQGRVTDWPAAVEEQVSRLARVGGVRAARRRAAVHSLWGSRERQLRESLAQDLHDHVAGTLMAMLLDLTHFQQTAGDPQLKRTFEDLEWQAREALREIRQIVYDLDRGRQLTNGLAARITEYLRHSTIATDISVALDVAPDWPSAVSVDFARAVFSIITQAVNNVRLHSGAQSATVRLAVDDEHALIEIKDDGVGIHVLPKKALGAKGLNSMKQRARGAGGTLEIVDLPHDGSAIRARIPFRITS